MKKIVLFLTFFLTTVTFGQCVIEVNSSSCSGTNALIQIMSGEIYDQYQWYFQPVNSTGGFQMMTGETNPSLACNWSTYDQTYVKVYCIYNNGIEYFSNTILLDQANCSLGNHDNHLADLILSPNPVRDYLVLSGFENLDRVEIFNTIGQRIFLSTDSNPTKIDTSSFASGVYVLNAISGNNSKQLKFIKS